MNDPAGRFTAETMAKTLQRIAHELGITASDAQLLRLTNNAVFALPTEGLVVRITRSQGLLDRADKVAALGRWFARVDAPTIRLAELPQPIKVDGLAATIWQYIAPHPTDPTVEDLGNVLRQFHRLSRPTMHLPTWDPIDDARRRLADAEALTESARDELVAWCDKLAPKVERLIEDQTVGLLHGDAHVGNLLRDHTGRVLLCDFDATCLGPWQVDLVAVAVGEIRFGRVGAKDRLAVAYGYDVTRDPSWPTLREARELKMVAAAVPLLASTPGIAEEFAHRLRSARQGNTRARWTPYADLQ